MKEKWIPVDDLFRDFQKIRGEETGENPTKAPSSTFFLSRFSGFWFSIEQVQQREGEREFCWCRINQKSSLFSSCMFVSSKKIIC